MSPFTATRSRAWIIDPASTIAAPLQTKASRVPLAPRELLVVRKTPTQRLCRPVYSISLAAITLTLGELLGRFWASNDRFGGVPWPFRGNGKPGPMGRFGLCDDILNTPFAPRLMPTPCWRSDTRAYDSGVVDPTSPRPKPRRRAVNKPRGRRHDISISLHLGRTGPRGPARGQSGLCLASSSSPASTSSW